MRCLALGQAWQDIGGNVVLAVAEIIPALHKRLLSEGMLVNEIDALPGSAADIAQVVGLAMSNRAIWIVVDGYHFDSSYQRGIKDAGLKLLFIDDNGYCEQYFADLVLNQNLHAKENLYGYREGYTQLLLGSRFAMLRREFRKWKEWKREIAPIARKVLVTMGGSDPENMTEQVIQAINLVDLEDLKMTAVIGGSASCDNSIQCATDKTFPAIRFERDPLNMPELMARADIAVSAAGSTCWELCCLSLPSLLIDVAENQTPVARELARQEIAIHLGSSKEAAVIDMANQIRELLLVMETRQIMAQRARELVDGEGARRVIGAMLSEQLRLRPTESDDCRLLWEWANDPEVRAASFSSDPIEWERHVEWFDSKLRDPNSVLWVVTKDNCPIGQVRFQTFNLSAVVSLSIGPKYRGMGLSNAVLELAQTELFRNTEIKNIHAYVKPTNAASLKLLANAGFEQLPDTERISNEVAVHFVLGKHP
jgi:UDP-2,4-diacetamido-2,4,6-trideoxy-beta-L-altropyranose hydrolase